MERDLLDASIHESRLVLFLFRFLKYTFCSRQLTTTTWWLRKTKHTYVRAVISTVVEDIAQTAGRAGRGSRAHRKGGCRPGGLASGTPMAAPRPGTDSGRQVYKTHTSPSQRFFPFLHAVHALAPRFGMCGEAGEATTPGLLADCCGGCWY